MRGGIGAQLALVVARRQHDTFLHHHRAHGNVAVEGGAAGFFERHAHEAFVFVGRPGRLWRRGRADHGSLTIMTLV